jgi:hypothetical protein
MQLYDQVQNFPYPHFRAMTATCKLKELGLESDYAGSYSAHLKCKHDDIPSAPRRCPEGA